MIYLDHSATTRPLPEAVEAVHRALTERWGNPSSLHRMGLEAERLLAEARSALAAAMGVDPEEVVFTSGATEANNLALWGIARGRREAHVVVSAVEHSSVLEVAHRMRQEGVRVDVVPVDREGFVRPDVLQQLVGPGTNLVSVMLVNNEVGTVQPLGEVVRILNEVEARSGRRPLLHVDAVQGFLKVEVRPRTQRFDLVSLSGHKVGGPKGIGALYVRRGVRLVPLLGGGDQEQGLRPGTENVPGAAGFGAAVRAQLGTWRRDAERMRTLRDLLRELLSGLPGVIWNTPDRDIAPHILNFAVPGVRGEVLVHRLEQEGVVVSTGSACHSRKARPSHVLLAMGRTEQEAMSSIRVSLGPQTSEEEIRAAVEAIHRAVRDLRMQPVRR
ncbi:MAG: cysteine desulfurase [Armatimonadetes bacterium]|nr:cysteine desulfurase [Armatimonadota bacterium]MDW8153061.1 cysteine desulfurase family protein [Armatimonadota bacterium]